MFLGKSVLKRLFEELPWKLILSQSYVGWIRMKTCSPTNFPSPLDNIFLTVTENKFIVWNYIFSGPTSIYLFEFWNDNSKIKCELRLKFKIEAPEVVLVGVFIVNFEYIWHVVLVFSCWLWTYKWRMEYSSDLII